jgi:hypothetical protein
MMSLRQTKGDDAHPMEENMNKTLIALFTATAALAATVGQAEAGFGLRIGFGAIGLGLGAFHHGSEYGSYQAPRRVYRAQRVQERAPVHARKVQPTTVAKEEIKKDETVAHNENSSITVADDKVATVESSSITVAADPVKITETKKTADAAKVIEPVKTETKKTEPAVAQKIDCKKFFPSVGLTLTVPCE